MADSNILIDRSDGIAIITINRPQALNALNLATIAELQEAFNSLEADRSTRAVIVTGAGSRAFVAGADVHELLALPDSRAGVALAESGHALCARIESLTQPVIAAINGFALGGGCELALACDIRIAASNIRMGQPEVNLGLVPGWGGTQRLPRLIGPGRASLMILTADTVDAQEAYRIGLVDRLVEPDVLMDEVRKLAETIAVRAPLAVAAAKRAIRAATDLPLARGQAYEATLFGQLFETEDHREGLTALLERRRPEFRGQ